jgi:hypothetical protein
MNRTIKLLLIVFSISSALLAFEDDFSLAANKIEVLKDPFNIYSLNYNPAGLPYVENKEVFNIRTFIGNNGYKRTFDAASYQNYNAEYWTLRKINDVSFFAAGITYDDQRMQDMFGSREKDFYDDYFSTIDSTGGNTGFYGPKLNIFYNVKLADDLYFGVKGNYGVERGLKDTFPETITIMRNSTYHLGLDYRKESFGIGLHARYYEDQTYYESVKSYSDVIAKTFMGYNVIYNEIASSTSKKKRNRNGFEYGGHVRFNKDQSVIFTTSISGLFRTSRSEMYSSYSKPRGFWVRQGVHIQSGLTFNPNESLSLQLNGEYLGFNDWGQSLITNTLILENRETLTHMDLGVLFRPSMVFDVYVGGGAGSVSYDYKEYIQSFEDQRSGMEWDLYAGTDIYVSSKTKLNINLDYGKEVPIFFWNTDHFTNFGARINLEQLFSFGYIGIRFENINKKPSDDSQTINLMQVGLSFRRK